jgi:cytochrome b pre-mRNA-processing protein 3
MIFPLFRRRRADDTITTLYGMIVAQARLPTFYQVYAVPDTVDGRFELILLHLYLFLRHSDSDPSDRELGQQVFDLFCRDMDRNLREMGISDLKVPKEMQRMGEAFYGRARAYEAAVATGDINVVAKAISRNVYGSEGAKPEAAARLGAYMMDALAAFSRQDPNSIQRGIIGFPAPM